MKKNNNNTNVTKRCTCTKKISVTFISYIVGDFGNPFGFTHNARVRIYTNITHINCIYNMVLLSIILQANVNFAPSCF